MRSVATHAAAVAELLEPIRRSLEPVAIELSPASMAENPGAYLNRVLAEDIVAPLALPGFDNSQMDGYAVRSAELVDAAEATPVLLPVAQTIAAGDAVSELQEGTTAAIMTGAPVPLGADAVVPIERVAPPRFPQPGQHDDDAAGRRVAFSESVTPGTFVREAGGDVPAGALLLSAGARLGPAQYAVLASSGFTEAPVLRAVRVLLVSTGHELRAPGESLRSGQLYDTNSSALTAALIDSGAEVVPARASDRAGDLRAVLARMGPSADVVVTTGGVSAGAFEVVRDVFGPFGVEFSSVAMQPGGPQGWGVANLASEHEHPAFSVPVVAFPGNPVSALISFEMFLRPVLRELAGLPSMRRSERLPLAHDVDSIAQKHQVRRGVLNEEGKVELVAGAGSHLVHAYAMSSLLVHLPVGVGHGAAGDLVETWRIDE